MPSILRGEPAIEPGVELEMKSARILVNVSLLKRFCGVGLPRPQGSQRSFSPNEGFPKFRRSGTRIWQRLGSSEVRLALPRLKRLQTLLWPASYRLLKFFCIPPTFRFGSCSLSRRSWGHRSCGKRNRRARRSGLVAHPLSGVGFAPRLPTAARRASAHAREDFVPPECAD